MIMSGSDDIRDDGNANEDVELESEVEFDFDAAAVIDCCERRAERLGLDGVSAIERVVILVSRVNFERELGGFAGFYRNAAGDHAVETVEALETIGARAAAEAVRRANALFEGGAPSSDRAARLAQWENFMGLSDLGMDADEDDNDDGAEAFEEDDDGGAEAFGGGDGDWTDVPDEDDGESWDADGDDEDDGEESEGGDSPFAAHEALFDSESPSVWLKLYEHMTNHCEELARLLDEEDGGA